MFGKLSPNLFAVMLCQEYKVINETPLECVTREVTLENWYITKNNTTDCAIKSKVNF